MLQQKAKAAKLMCSEYTEIACFFICAAFTTFKNKFQEKLDLAIQVLLLSHCPTPSGGLSCISTITASMEVQHSPCVTECRESAQVWCFKLCLSISTHEINLSGNKVQIRLNGLEVFKISLLSVFFSVSSPWCNATSGLFYFVIFSNIVVALMLFCSKQSRALSCYVTFLIIKHLPGLY